MIKEFNSHSVTLRANVKLHNGGTLGLGVKRLKLFVATMLRLLVL